MATKTATLRAGLLASGWQPCETRSGRECFTKVCKAFKLVAGKAEPSADQQMWLWLGAAGSVRWAPKNAFTDSYPPNAKMIARLLAAGADAKVGGPINSDDLLSKLES